jgi:hypothetical protein
VGGHGSGKWLRLDTKVKTSTLFRIDIQDLKHISGLEPGAQGKVEWRELGFLYSIVFYEVKEDCLILEYEHKPLEKDAQHVRETIWFKYTTPNFGGKRAWFSCPQCRKRVAVLFRVDRRFRCRKCHNLSYKTQGWDEFDRSGNKARKIRIKLGGSGGLGEAFPPKPVGMHLRTYFTLMQKAMKAERRFWSMMEQKMDQLFG